ncbi:MAG: hypothetical protein IPL95_12020 [Saprospiraceae bacterium]|nr:hypothetical protein [Saprospiraceae bacterium]
MSGSENPTSITSLMPSRYRYLHHANQIPSPSVSVGLFVAVIGSFRISCRNSISIPLVSSTNDTIPVIVVW